MFYLCTKYRMNIFYVYTYVSTTRYSSKNIFYGIKNELGLTIIIYWLDTVLFLFKNTIAILNWNKILVELQTLYYQILI